jgi:tetratricopeptide (TPR) repeat protein
LAILGEVRGEMGAVLWKSLRSVTLWAEADSDSRWKMFDGWAADRRQLEILATVPAHEPALRESLEDLLPLLAQPERADPAFAAVACRRIATWAEGQGFRRTEIEFLQAAALCCPADPAFALAVGRTARDLAQYGRAEAWLYRAVGLARQARDWPMYVRAYLQHGVMMLRRGVLPAARRSMLKALRRSRRQGLRDGEAWALHDLFTLEWSAGEPDLALDYAREAVRAHGPGHSALPRLAHDIAYFWLERGDSRHALPIFLETLGRVGPVERPTVLGSVSRAAAGVGDAEAFEWARDELTKYSPAPGVAESWVEVARGALVLERHEEAREAARLAESVARTRREGRVRFLAESVMEQIHAEVQAAAALAAARAREPSLPADRLARELLRFLQEPSRRSEAPRSNSLLEEAAIADR